MAVGNAPPVFDAYEVDDRTGVRSVLTITSFGIRFLLWMCLFGRCRIDEDRDVQVLHEFYGNVYVKVFVGSISIGYAKKFAERNGCRTGSHPGPTVCKFGFDRRTVRRRRISEWRFFFLCILSLTTNPFSCSSASVCGARALEVLKVRSRDRDLILASVNPLTHAVHYVYFLILIFFLLS